MDISSIIVAGIAFAGTVFGSYFANSKTTALVTYRLAQLEDKVNKHNHLVERMTVVEGSLNTAWKRIDEIREELKEVEENE
ncbi:hypothetical protein ACDL92_10995 [Ihubacter sp. mB4P-1]|uniref:hypothetical protein n=1 Tax=Ihubacter sp. mB4P-1 TaxID=3242370 RepID=UPI001379A511